ncbi:MAG: FAD-dependent monooxygenase, partial [Nitrosomonadales bacterium]|nr:FAD-dependent monooxygenase [Nitrosomonadales bacterium]
HDFGRVMMVCVMEHEVSHQHVAWEWFDYGQTLALLPMNGMRSSVVVTMAAREIQDLMEMSEEDFSRAIEARFQHRLGTMQLVSTRHAYPLVTVYPDRFTSKRFALIGDAAVGMHPVTAHGFNFGLRGADALAREIKAAQIRGSDIASAGLLSRYERTHRRATHPLFLATHAIAKLYSDDSLSARLLRAASLRIGNRIVPFKRAVAKMLTEAN